MPRARKQAVVCFPVGTRVVIKYLGGIVGKVVEIRGPLGPGGAMVYRVRSGRRPHRSEVELMEHQFEAIPAAG